MSQFVSELASSKGTAPDRELCGHGAPTKSKTGKTTQGCVLCTSMKKLSLRQVSERINELALPKGNVVANCELCGQSATTKCENCKVTHYCSEKHKQTDWESFHSSICDKIAFIRGEHPLLFKTSEREEANEMLQQAKLDILKLAENRCRKWLLAKNSDYAYPPAMYAMNVAEDIKGATSVEIINPMCLVAEVYLGFEMFKAAQDYMIQATFIAHENKLVPPEVLVQLHRLRGLVFAKVSDWFDARESFSECVYFLAELHSTKDIRMAVGYGYLGQTQMELKNVEGGLTCFHKMCDMWLHYFLDQYERDMLVETTKIEMSDEHLREIEFQFQELKNNMRQIYELVRAAGMNSKTDLVMFKLLLLEILSWMRCKKWDYATIFKEEALSVAVRTKQDKAVQERQKKIVIDILGEDYILKWERRHNRPRTIATKYLEMIKKLDPII